MKIIKIANSVNDAIEQVLTEHNLTINDIEYTVLQQASKGFLGFGKKKAKVEFIFKQIQNEDKQKINTIPQKNFYKKSDSTIKTLNNNFFDEHDLTNSNENNEIINKVNNFLSEIFQAMDINVNIESKFINPKKIFINLTGDNIGVVIGKRGQTLDSLQYLSNLIVNKNKSYINVEIDSFEYRQKRKQSLENLALNLVKKVKKTNKPIKLEPMNSYERKIIHSILKSENTIKSFSEGQEPFRYVVIVPKK